MAKSIRSLLPSPARAGLRSAAVTSPEGRRPGGELLTDRSLLDEEFDELGCEVPVLLRIVNQL